MTLPTTDDQASVLEAQKQDSFFDSPRIPFDLFPEKITFPPCGRLDAGSSLVPSAPFVSPRHCGVRITRDTAAAHPSASFRKLSPVTTFPPPRRTPWKSFSLRPCFPERSKTGIKAEESLPQSTKIRAIELAGANLNESARISRVDGWKAKSGDLQVK